MKPFRFYVVLLGILIHCNSPLHGVETIDNSSSTASPTAAGLPDGVGEVESSNTDTAAGRVADGRSGQAVDQNATYELRYKFRQDETLRWEVNHLVTVETAIQGTTQKAETGSRSTKTWRIISVDTEGNAVFVHSVEDVDMWQRVTGRQEIRYNSSTDDKVPPEYENVAASVGVPLSTITLSTVGEVIERNDRKGSKQEQHAIVTMPFPGHPVRIQDQWETPYVIPVRTPNGTLINIQARQVFRLEKVVAGLATISLDTEVLSPVKDPRIRAQLVQRLLGGTIKFDIDAGCVRRQRMELKESVLAFSGAESSMDYKARFTEDLVEVDLAAISSEQASSGKSPDGSSSRPVETAGKRGESPRRRR